jgi:hypothetical protein
LFKTFEERAIFLSKKKRFDNFDVIDVSIRRYEIIRHYIGPATTQAT